MILTMVKWFWIFPFVLIKNKCPLKFLIFIHIYLSLTELLFSLLSPLLA